MTPSAFQQATSNLMNKQAYLEAVALSPTRDCVEGWCIPNRVDRCKVNTLAIVQHIKVRLCEKIERLHELQE